MNINVWFWPTNLSTLLQKGMFVSNLKKICQLLRPLRCEYIYYINNGLKKHQGMYYRDYDLTTQLFLCKFALKSVA